MKKLYFLLLMLFIGFGWESTQAQNGYYTISPGDTVMGSAPYDTYTDFHMNFQNITGGKIKISWQLLSNGLSSSWDYSFCDNSYCYLGIPTGIQSMDSVDVGAYGFFKLSLNPSTVSANGVVRLLVFPSGHMSTADTVTFIVNSVPMAVSETGKSPLEFSLFPNPATDFVQVAVSGGNKAAYGLSLFDMVGNRVADYTVSRNGNIRVPLSGLPAGFYFIQYTDDKGNRQVRKIHKIN